MIGARLPWLLLCCLCLWWPATAGAQPIPEDSRLRIDLITIGPGDPLLTRAGHTALLVSEVRPDGRVRETTYNFGDTDFSDRSVPTRFLFGRLRFFLSEAGTLYDVAELYGRYQDRDVVRQPLALTQAQARRIATQLAEQVAPDRREYDYHYLEQTCSTKVRDLLDEVTGGELRRQLADPDPWTVRDYQQLTFDGYVLTALLGDALFGRVHDQPIDRYYALLWPQRMSTYLAEVTVPDPEGGAGRVPLAGPIEPVAARGGPPRTVERNHITWWFASAMIAWALLGAAWLSRHGPQRPRLAALWLLSWALPSGLLGALIVLLELGSSVPQLRSNELGLSLLVTDLLLVGVAVGWLRRRTLRVPSWLVAYAHVRALLVGVAVLLRAIGVFVQQPWLTPVASLACSLGLLGMIVAWRRQGLVARERVP